MIPLTDDDIPTPEDEAKRADAAAADAHYAELLDQSEQDVLAALQERDEVLAALEVSRDLERRAAWHAEKAKSELAAAAAELEKMRDQRDALARYIELIADPMHAPSRPRQRPRFAGEDHDDYALRGE